MKAKIRSKPDFIKAEQSKDSIWFLKNLEDIILNFEDTKPVILALDDQLETIITLKLGNHSNEDFIKLVSKELKVFEKQGGDFLWGDTCRKELTKRLEDAYVGDKGVAMTKDELMDA